MKLKKTAPLKNKNHLKVAIIGLKGLPANSGAAAAYEGVINNLKDNFRLKVYSITSHTDIQGEWNGVEQITFKSIKHHGLNFFLYFIKSAFHCLFKQKGMNLVHVHHLAGAFIIPILRLRYKVIFTFHGFPDKTDKWKAISWIYYPIMRSCALYFSNIATSVSKSHAKYLNKKFNKKTIYIPNGVNITSFDNFVKAPDNDYLLFSAGRIIEIKGCHFLLEALHQFQYKDKVKIIGDLNQVKDYKKKILNLAEGLNIEFTGLIKDRNLLFKNIIEAKLFIFPSLIEAMSSMLLEVASQKTPVICSDIEENKAVFDTEEVLFFRSGDVNDLCKKITWALANNTIMEQKAQKAYHKVLNEYSFDPIAKEYEKLYKQILNVE